MIESANKTEAVRLRVEERRSINEISKELRISKGTLSVWLRSYPLTEEEKRAKISQRRVRSGHRKPRGEMAWTYGVLSAQKLSREQKGKIAETAVLFRLVLYGFEVYASPFDGDKADWIVSGSNGRLLRIQVKWAAPGEHGLPLVSLKCNNVHKGRRRYQEGEFDILAAYDAYTDTAYVFTFDELKDNRSTKSITPDAIERWDKLRA